MNYTDLRTVVGHQIEEMTEQPEEYKGVDIAPYRRLHTKLATQSPKLTTLEARAAHTSLDDMGQRLLGHEPDMEGVVLSAIEQARALGVAY